LEEQLGKTAAQIRQLDKLLTDPAVPLTPDAERRNLELLRDAENDRQRLTQKLAQHEAQANPVQVIPHFYTILADFSKEFALISPIDQKRLMRHVIQDINFNTLTPHLFQLHVVWQNGMATCPDIALIWRGMAPKTDHAWSENEDTIMRTLYASAEQEHIMRSLPDRTWSRIYERAQDLHLRRSLPHNGPHPFNTYHRTLTYHDLEAVAGLVSAQDQQDRMRQVVNDLARRTMRGGLTAHWWLPLGQISYAGDTTPE
jgi:hypothetical protein